MNSIRKNKPLCLDRGGRCPVCAVLDDFSKNPAGGRRLGLCAQRDEQQPSGDGLGILFYLVRPFFSVNCGAF